MFAATMGCSTCSTGGRDEGSIWRRRRLKPASARTLQKDRAARYLEECLPHSEYWDVPPSGQTATTAPARRTSLIVLIALSRVMLRVHWVSDVAGGITIGLGWLVCSLVLTRALHAYRAPAPAHGAPQKNRSAGETS